MEFLIKAMSRASLFKTHLDYHLVRGSMVIIFLFFGYQKWFEYEAQALIPYISNGPLTFWMYPVFGIRGASWFLGVSEWLICALLFWGFWNWKAGILGAIGSCATFVTTVTIIPFMPAGWAASAGGFPAMTGNVAFLMKDVVLLAVSLYLLKQDLVRASSSRPGDMPGTEFVRTDVMVPSSGAPGAPPVLSRAAQSDASQRTGQAAIIASPPE